MDKEKNNDKEEIELSDEEFLAACKEAGIEKSLKSYLQKEGDRRVDQGIKSFQKNQETKNFSDSEKIINLENELKELKGTLSKKDLDTAIEVELVKQNLSKGLSKYIKAEDPSKIAESVTNLKNDLLKIEQEKIDLKLKDGTAPLHGEANTGTGDSVTKSYVENKNAGKIAGNPFSGKLDNKKGDK